MQMNCASCRDPINRYLELSKNPNTSCPNCKVYMETMEHRYNNNEKVLGLPMKKRKISSTTEEDSDEKPDVIDLEGDLSNILPPKFKKPTTFVIEDVSDGTSEEKTENEEIEAESEGVSLKESDLDIYLEEENKPLKRPSRSIIPKISTEKRINSKPRRKPKSDAPKPPKNKKSDSLSPKSQNPIEEKIPFGNFSKGMSNTNQLIKLVNKLADRLGHKVSKHKNKMLRREFQLYRKATDFSKSQDNSTKHEIMLKLYDIIQAKLLGQKIINKLKTLDIPGQLYDMLENYLSFVETENKNSESNR